LKPANIKVRPDGTVKVLDFGLAKALEPTSVVNIGATASPTITSPAMMTGVGVLLGTAAYMSPEQARGKVVDKRSDIWAFGCVLYEMLTGKRAFGGEEISETLAKVIRGELDWKALPAGTPAAVRRLLRRCFIKIRRGAWLTPASSAWRSKRRLQQSRRRSTPRLRRLGGGAWFHTGPWLSQRRSLRR
jgi:serine/threonine protein kinase